MKLTKQSTLFIIMILIFGSCKDDLERVESESVNENLSELSGIANFSSFEEFNNSLYVFQSEGVMPLNMSGVKSLSYSDELKSTELESEEIEDDPFIKVDPPV